MSSTYLANPASFQLLNFPLIRRITGWFTNYCLAAAKRRSLAAVRHLPRETLEDIGVDFEALHSEPSRLVRSNPYVIAFSGCTDIRFFDVH